MQCCHIAIDGPAGAGKSTVAKLVAERLGYLFVDTGAMYRCVALAALRRGLAVDHEAAMGELAGRVEIRFGPLEAGRQRVWLDGEEVTDAIRTPAVHAVVSPVSAIPAVREAMVAEQRALAAGRSVVMEGRDIQTVVLPGAELKIYLDAGEPIRTDRRFRELPPGRMSREEVAANLRDRDTRDSGRAVAPLQPAADAVRIDTEPLTAAEVAEQIIALVRERCGSVA